MTNPTIATERSRPIGAYGIAILALVFGLAILTFIAISRFSTTTPLPTADSILVIKHAHTLTLFHKGQTIKQYRVALGRGGLGPKDHAGDNRVPEGTYRIVSRNPHSAFYRALRVGYPTPQQTAAAHAHGVDPGGDIMIHGVRNGLGWLGPAHRLIDWTKGCIAVTDPEMDEIWNAVPDGTPIEIRP
jgi:murein L,D-transpeptidase YafK